MSSRIAGQQTLNVFRVYDSSVLFLPLYPQDFDKRGLSGAPNAEGCYCEHTVSFYARSTLFNGIAPLRVEIPPTIDLNSEEIYNSTDLQLQLVVDGETVVMDIAAGGRYVVWARNLSASLLIPTPNSIPGAPLYIAGNFSDFVEAYENVVLPPNVIVVNDYVSVTLGTCQTSNFSRRPRLTRNYRFNLVEQPSQGPNVFRVPSRASKVTFYRSTIGNVAGTVLFSRDGQFGENVRSVPADDKQPIDVPGNARFFSLAVPGIATIVTAVWELDL